jgi:hypothetical protein
LVAAFIWVWLSALKSLNGRAFSKASELGHSVDNNFAALGFIGRADLVTTLVRISLGNGVDRDAESDGDNGVVEEHVGDLSNCCSGDSDMTGK